MKKLISLFIVSTFFLGGPAYAADPPQGTGEQGAGLSESQVADSPSKCGSKEIKTTQGKKYWGEPVNCVFLEEPIGGKEGYDLYTKTCEEDTPEKGQTRCTYAIWSGGYIDQKTKYGPYQAILSFEKDKPYQGPFGLLYNYLGLVYKYMSGLIVGVAVLFTVIGGIQMSTSMGDTAKFEAGRARILKAIVGIIIWFTASLILYTINPTFFAF